jgi:hypothetical protein
MACVYVTFGNVAPVPKLHPEDIRDVKVKLPV